MNYGTVEYEGKTLTLTQNAYVNNYGTNGEVRYFAMAEDSEGNEYEVVWETTEAWDLAGELAALENVDYPEEYQKERIAELNEMNVCSSFCDDESNACDWDNPVEVNEI